MACLLNGNLDLYEIWNLSSYKIVIDHQPNFQKDPCKDARARGENARTCDAL